MSEQPSLATAWTSADFLDRAQELKRRLEVWHIPGSEPIYAPKDLVLLMEAEREVFRDRVMRGEHDPNPNFTTWNVVGDKFIRRPKDPYSKFITKWEMREFIERLERDAGNSEEAKLVRLKLERLLDAPMHRRARSEGFGDYIAGRPVDPSLLAEFEEAVRAFASKHSAVPNSALKGDPSLTKPIPSAEPIVAQETKSAGGDSVSVSDTKVELVRSSDDDDLNTAGLPETQGSNVTDDRGVVKNAAKEESESSPKEALESDKADKKPSQEPRNRQSLGEEVYSQLTGQSAKLFKFLLERERYVNFDTLRDTFKSDEPIFTKTAPTDYAVRQAVKRLNTSLYEYPFSCAFDGKRVKLEYLDLSKGPTSRGTSTDK